MYCANCGKWIDYDATLCKKCEIEEKNRLYPSWDNRLYGFGSALTSCIAGLIGYLLFCASMLVLRENEAFFPFVYLPSIPLTVFALITGIRSIRCFVKRKAPYVKPVATLVLGIVTTVISSFGAFFALYIGVIGLFS